MEDLHAVEKYGRSEVTQAYKTDISNGLGTDEAEKRRLQFGVNELIQKKQKSAFLRFLSEFKDPMIYILLAAAIISLALGETKDCIIILAVLLINGVIGYIQQSRAEKAIEALKKLSNPKALVRRDGKTLEIESRELVPGDVVLIEAGRSVPADLRLFETASLKIEESALTGEAEPVDKDAEFVASGDLPLGDRINMAYASTNVTYGRGVGIVTGTGMHTEIGKIAASLEDAEEKMTPLQKRLADLGKVLGITTVVLCVQLFGIAVLRRYNIFSMLLTAISLAVAAIPEGLPAVVTIVLAIGVQRMVKSHAIIRRLQAVETLGCVNIVCSDKTGTLTQNRMTVTACYLNGQVQNTEKLDAAQAQLFLCGFTLCNDASIEGEKALGDPTETALLTLSDRFSVKKSELSRKYPRIDELPFDSQRKMMTTVHMMDGRRTAFTKGALDSILAHTDFILESGRVRPITEADRDDIAQAAKSMAKDALRVLALAYREYGSEEAYAEDALIFIGLAGMIDPPRSEAGKAVRTCKKAGITVVMITGDHRDTALAIARSLGIAKEESQVISGDELDKLSQEELNSRVSSLRVFARVSPEHKVRIVRAFKAGGNIVSMTGDGVNDAPSLKAADIGVAMGITGTDAARGAADMILMDDNFATIEKAVEEGRNVYNNIRKVTLFLLSSNFGEIITMFVGILLGMPVPLLPIHILWVNLITDSVPGLALGMDPGDPGVMAQKPRPAKESLFARGGTFIMLFYGAVIGLISLLGFAIGNHTSGLVAGRTMALSILSVSQLFHAIGMRNTEKSIFRTPLFSNRPLVLSVLLGTVIQIALAQFPVVNAVFSLQPLRLRLWGYALLLSLMPLIAHELILLFRRPGNRGHAA